jgi:succinoglycan biosynthesis transport protein ExoP
MLQPTHLQSAIDATVQNSSEQRGLVDAAYGLLLRHYMLILFITLLAVAAGVTFVLVTPPSYTTYARVMIGTQQKAQFVQQQSILTDGPIDVEGQIQILQSRAIVSSVVEELKLMDDPEFAPRAVGFVRRVSNVFTDLLSTKVKLDPTETAIAAVSSRLTVGRVGGSLLMVEIGFSSQSREKSAQIANAVANAYIVDQADAKRQTNRTASEWLEERLRQLGQQNAAAGRAVLAFRQEHNIVAPAGKRIDEQSLTDLNARLVAARTQTSDLLARLNIIESIIRNWNSNMALDAAISDTLTNPILTSLRQQYLDLARREAEYSARYGRDHLAVVNLRNKMRDLRSSTFDELRRTAAAFRSDYEIARQRQADVETQLDQVISQSQTANKAHVALRELESTANTYQSLYDSFLQRQMAGVQGDSFPLSDARLVSLASASESRSKPKPAFVLALSLIGGIALGVGAGLLRDSLDRVFRTGDQVRSLLQIPCIALVPLLKANPPTRSNKRTPTKALGPRTIARDSSMFWRAVERPLSAFAESIRSIRLAASLNLTDRPNKVIGLTSSLPNEGKSTIATALAQLTAQMGRRVILVDCDLRNPTLSRCLAPSATIGIVDVMSGVRSLEEAVWRDPATNLVFLPTGKGTPQFHSSEMLGLEQTSTLFDRLRASFDLVIVDLPPLAPVVDVGAAAHLVDGMILVIEWGGTKIDVVQHAFDNAPNVHEVVIGAVLNKTDMSQIGRYDTQRKSFYNNKHYTKYGYSEG